MRYARAHGKSGGSATRLCGVGSTPAGGREAADAGRERSRGCATGGGASPVGESVGEAASDVRARGPEAWRARGAPAAAGRGRSAAGGTGLEAWPRGPGVCDRAVDGGASSRSDRAGVWGAIPPGPCLAAAQAAWVELPTADRPSAGAGRRGHSRVDAAALAGVKKNAARVGQTIVFVDESGLSERPHRCRTWGPA